MLGTLQHAVVRSAAHCVAVGPPLPGHVYVFSWTHCYKKLPSCISRKHSRKGAFPGQAYGVCAVNSGVATSLRGGGGRMCKVAS